MLNHQSFWRIRIFLLYLFSASVLMRQNLFFENHKKVFLLYALSIPKYTGYNAFYPWSPSIPENIIKGFFWEKSNKFHQGVFFVLFYFLACENIFFSQKNITNLFRPIFLCFLACCWKVLQVVLLSTTYIY